MPSIFSRIVSGEIPAYKIAENEQFLAFLDAFPAAKGHTLVIPKKEIDYIFDLDDNTYIDLMAFSKKIATGLEKAIPCKRIGVAVVGLEVPHVHVHLIPINGMADMNFSNKLKFTPEEMALITATVKKHLAD